MAIKNLSFTVPSGQAAMSFAVEWMPRNINGFEFSTLHAKWKMLHNYEHYRLTHKCSL